MSSFGLYTGLNTESSFIFHFMKVITTAAGSKIALLAQQQTTGWTAVVPFPAGAK
jgi:hypothetical protein